jgi:hypothetical protein
VGATNLACTINAKISQKVQLIYKAQQLKMLINLGGASLGCGVTGKLEKWRKGKDAASVTALPVCKTSEIELLRGIGVIALAAKGIHPTAAGLPLPV